MVATELPVVSVDVRVASTIGMLSVRHNDPPPGMNREQKVGSRKPDKRDNHIVVENELETRLNDSQQI